MFTDANWTCSVWTNKWPQSTFSQKTALGCNGLTKTQTPFTSPVKMRSQSPESGCWSNEGTLHLTTCVLVTWMLPASCLDLRLPIQNFVFLLTEASGWSLAGKTRWRYILSRECVTAAFAPAYLQQRSDHNVFLHAVTSVSRRQDRKLTQTANEVKSHVGGYILRTQTETWSQPARFGLQVLLFVGQKNLNLVTISSKSKEEKRQSIWKNPFNCAFCKIPGPQTHFKPPERLLALPRPSKRSHMLFIPKIQLKT